MKFWRGRIVCLDFYKLYSYFLMFLCSLFTRQRHDWQWFTGFTKEGAVWLFKSSPELLIKVHLMTANKNCSW